MGGCPPRDELFLEAASAGAKPLDQRGLIQCVRTRPQFPRGDCAGRNPAGPQDVGKQKYLEKSALPPPHAQAHGRATQDLLKKGLIGESNMLRNLHRRPPGRCRRERPSAGSDGARERQETLDCVEVFILKPLPCVRRRSHVSIPLTIELTCRGGW